MSIVKQDSTWNEKDGGNNQLLLSVTGEDRRIEKPP
jgi:hypothetical protein